MASYTPPTENLPIFDNEVFKSTNDSTTLTVGLANLLYLRKTFADTCTALETFSGGIASNSIQSTTATTALSIGSSQTDGILNLGAGGSRTATGAINIGTGGTSNPCIVNIANGGITQAGAVNIANTGGPSISTAVNIGNGSSTGGVSIGNPASNVTLGGASILIANNSVGGTVQIKNANNSVGEVQIVTSGGGTNTTPVKISTGTTTGTVSIGNPLNATSILSGTTNINTGVGTLALPLAGTVNIATGTGAGFVSTNVNIGSTDSTGTVNILSGTGSSMNIANGTGSRTITIGNTSNVVNLANLQINSNIIGPRTGSSLQIGSSGNTLTVLSGTTNVNTGVGTLALPLAGTVNIATGTGAGFVSTAVNIGTGDTTGAITIGSASSTATVGIRNPRMTLSYTAVPTLTSSQIGYTFTVNAPTTLGGTALVVTGAQTAFLSIASVPIGLWLVNYATRITGTGVATNVTKYQTWINITNQDVTTPYAYGPSGFGTLSMPVGAYNSGISQSIATNGSGVIKTVTSTGTISLTYMATVTPATSISFWNDGVGQPSSTFLTITRIG